MAGDYPFYTPKQKPIGVGGPGLPAIKPDFGDELPSVREHFGLKPGSAPAQQNAQSLGAFLAGMSSGGSQPKAASPSVPTSAPLPPAPSQAAQPVSSPVQSSMPLGSSAAMPPIAIPATPPRVASAVGLPVPPGRPTAAPQVGVQAAAAGAPSGRIPWNHDHAPEGYRLLRNPEAIFQGTYSHEPLYSDSGERVKNFLIPLSKTPDTASGVNPNDQRALMLARYRDAVNGLAIEQANRFNPDGTFVNGTATGVSAAGWKNRAGNLLQQLRDYDEMNSAADALDPSSARPTAAPGDVGGLYQKELTSGLAGKLQSQGSPDVYHGIGGMEPKDAAYMQHYRNADALNAGEVANNHKMAAIEATQGVKDKVGQLSQLSQMPQQSRDLFLAGIGYDPDQIQQFNQMIGGGRATSAPIASTEGGPQTSETTRVFPPSTSQGSTFGPLVGQGVSTIGSPGASEKSQFARELEALGYLPSMGWPSGVGVLGAPDTIRSRLGVKPADY